MSKGILLSEHPPESGYLPASSIQVSLTPLRFRSASSRGPEALQAPVHHSPPLPYGSYNRLPAPGPVFLSFHPLSGVSPRPPKNPRATRQIPGGRAASPARCPAAPDSASELYQGSPPWYGCNPAYRCSFSGALPAGFPYHHPGPSAPTQNPGLPAPGRSSRRESAESSTRQTPLLPDAFYHSIL